MSLRLLRSCSLWFGCVLSLSCIVSALGWFLSVCLNNVIVLVCGAALITPGRSSKLTRMSHASSLCTSLLSSLIPYTYPSPDHLFLYKVLSHLCTCICVDSLALRFVLLLFSRPRSDDCAHKVLALFIPELLPTRSPSRAAASEMCASHFVNARRRSLPWTHNSRSAGYVASGAERAHRPFFAPGRPCAHSERLVGDLEVSLGPEAHGP